VCNTSFRYALGIFQTSTVEATVVVDDFLISSELVETSSFE